MKPNQSESRSERRRPTRLHLKLSLLGLLTALAWAGCTHKAAVTADTNPAGVYGLVSVDGKQLPCALQHAGAAPTIKSGKFTINADGTCNSLIVFSLPSRGDSSREVKATYTRQGAKLTMQWQGAGTTVGTVEGDTFTMSNEGMVFVYRKT